MTKHAAILGCGPAGLMAALACDLSGWDFTVLSRKEPSKLYGAQYLHQPLPGIDCGGPATVQYKLRGSAEQYRRKVYGDEWDGTVSPEDYSHAHFAWDIRAAYQRLWDMYHTEIKHTEISMYQAMSRRSFAGKDLVISTLPRTVWDPDPEHFVFERIWALGDTEIKRISTLHDPPPFTVICNGKAKPLWYRVSNIFGYSTMEWPGNQLLGDPEMPPTRGASLVKKPLYHTSKAAADFVHVGRYGKWEKGVLTTDAFYDTMRRLEHDRIDN